MQDPEERAGNVMLLVQSKGSWVNQPGAATSLTACLSLDQIKREKGVW